MIILLGESASGKSTIEKELVKRGLSKIVSYTTRPIRNDEADGIDYHYITEEEFQKLLSEDFFAEHTNYNGWYYGIAKKDCNDSSVVVIEPYGFRQLRKRHDLNIISFYIQVSQKERLIRLVKRDDGVMEIFRRIVSDQGVFQGIADEVDYVVDGEKNINNVINEITCLIHDRTLRCCYEPAN